MAIRMIVIALAIVLAVAPGGRAQEPGHGGTPAGRQPAAPAERPHAGMAMPEPMEAPIPDEGVPRATETKGAQPLGFRLENGVKVFELTARPVKWLILPAWRDLPDVRVTAWAYNGQVPGPLIRVTAGDRVRVVLRNELPAGTSIHWHGLRVPNAMDGVAEPPITQQPVMPGESFTYEVSALDDSVVVGERPSPPPVLKCARRQRSRWLWRAGTCLAPQEDQM